MNCLCNLFEDSTVWLIIIALLILYFGCNNTGCNTACGGCCNNTGCNTACGGCCNDTGYGCNSRSGICN